MSEAPRPFVAPTFAPLYTPAGGPPQQGPSRAIFGAMGEENLYRMCADFYERIGRSPIRVLFSDDLPAASRHLAAFFIGLLGGPPVYQQQRGDPRMRARHLAFPINEEARRVWLNCFCETLRDAERVYGFPAEHLPGFVKFLEEFSAWMVNRR